MRLRLPNFCRLCGSVAALLAGGWAAAGPVAAQESIGAHLEATRLSEEQAAQVTLDGFLNEDFWEGVPVAAGFRQREPVEGEPATDQTEIRVVYDGINLYIGVLARDNHPDKIVSRILQRDRVISRRGFGRLGFQGDDVVAILFDTFWDRRNGVVFATNPNGAEFEALVTDEGNTVNVDWRAVWSVKAQRVAAGWSAEFSIPFRTLRYFGGDGSQTWGFNIVRYVPHQDNEESLWSAWARDNEGFLRISKAGILDNLRDLPRSKANIEVKPYVLSGGTQEPNGVSGNLDTEGQLEIGGDVKWEVRPGLLLDLTVNTDFAQVEVDDQRINLTRFSLFFPEKRDFFLENSGIFEFGEQGTFGGPGFLMFFSRRIGLSDTGPVPVIGGARLTGRAGSRTIGLLNVVTDEDPSTPRRNFAVARVKQDVGENSYIGAMITDQRDSGPDNTAVGVDWRMWFSRSLNFQGYGARTITGGAGGDDNAYKATLDYTTDLIGARVDHLFIGSETNAAMGFVRRTDLRRTGAFFRVGPRPDVLGIRQIRTWVSGQYLTDTRGNLEDWRVSWNLNTTWNSGESVRMGFDRTFTRLTEDFNLPNDIVVPQGGYDNWQLQIQASTSDRRVVQVSGEWQREKFFEGDAWSARAALQLKPSPNINARLQYQRNEVDVPWGRLVSNITQFRLTYAFSTQVIVNALIQHDSLDQEISTNVRFNFIHRPGSDLFIVFNEERGSNASVWDTQSRGLVAKLTYLARI